MTNPASQPDMSDLCILCGVPIPTNRCDPHDCGYTVVADAVAKLRAQIEWEMHCDEQDEAEALRRDAIEDMREQGNALHDLPDYEESWNMG